MQYARKCGRYQERDEETSGTLTMWAITSCYGIYSRRMPKSLG
ncbi:hypothetical protein M758_3G123600 [Ceratodon purpureus]|nr:hypothetical protein M758_3G123600 [Ceratodon purpureus]